MEVMKYEGVNYCAVSLFLAVEMLIIFLTNNIDQILIFFYYLLSSSYPFPSLSKVGTTCFSSCCDKDSAIIFATGRLQRQPPLKLQWVLTTANAAGTNGLTCIPKHGGD
jgi:hypothetical protein